MKNKHLLRRVFHQALQLRALRIELTCTDFRLLRFTLLGWAAVSAQSKLQRRNRDANRRALLFRGLSLLSNYFHTWSRRASHRRRKLEAQQRYTTLLFKAAFFMWAAEAREGARRRRKASAMRGRRLVGEVLSSWREVVCAQCVDLPCRAIRVLRLRYLWDHWKTLNRSVMVSQNAVNSQQLRLMKTRSRFNSWKAHYDRKLKVRAGAQRLLLCKNRYLLRCSLLRWEGWGEERASKSLLTSFYDRRDKKLISVDTLNGPLVLSWDQHILAARWSSDESLDQDHEEQEKENAAEIPLSTAAAGDRHKDLNHLFSGDVGMLGSAHSVDQIEHQAAFRRKVHSRKSSSRFEEVPAKRKALAKRPNVIRTEVSKSVCSQDHQQSDMDAYKAGNRMTKVTRTGGKEKRYTRNPILDRALVLGYCSYREESQIPMLRCVRAIFRAFRIFVKTRRHCQKAYIYYRNNKYFESISTSFHFWMSKVPELSHRSASWLLPMPLEKNCYEE